MKASKFIRKSILSSILIGLGVYILLKIGGVVGAALFSLGLLSVCYLGGNLFTGKCGFIVEKYNSKKAWLELVGILAINLIAGFLLGVFFSTLDSEIVKVANEKVDSWSFDLVFLGKSVMCGVIMYIAVKLFREKSPLGILIGVPLFILCGFQHSIANVITAGVATSPRLDIILLCAFGNLVGSVIVAYLTTGLKSV